MIYFFNGNIYLKFTGMLNISLIKSIFKADFYIKIDLPNPGFYIDLVSEKKLIVCSNLFICMVF